MTVPRTPLTVDDIGRGYDDERWLGWGYLGGRGQLGAAELTRADRVVVDFANAHGWDYDRLFEWMNSRPGRHFADDPFGPHAQALLDADLTR